MTSPFLEPFQHALRELPLVAILRGLTPAEAPGVAHVLHDAGFRLIEVPLNSPQPFESIALIRQLLPADTLVGAGTVLQVADVERLRATGAGLVVMPHADTAVIRAASAAGLICLPGIATPTEAFAAIAAGACGLKLFPAETLGPAGLRAMRAVLPPALPVFPVGGITPDTLKPFVDAGARGFGLGSALYRPGMPLEAVAAQAAAFAAAWRALAPAEP
ncbi:MAG: 2-dehydro-3-deoxy-6-phosphogalactonate aldolase [Candidatus Dactylopiibacterium sp.]|nr:2-dehydro-3-deoxy-6-phosphogalactonate aldolase [Candidatus Dactylopiibacterium sp.]